MERIITIVSFLVTASAECDRNTGPSGIIECFSSFRYNGEYQWGTCLTDQYIQTKTRGQYQCEDRSRTYCYYQCMLELHDVLSGSIYDDCSCRPGDEYITSNLTLPSKCYSPPGNECGWYKDCLEKKYSCSGTKDDYAIKYATEFCNLYDEHYGKFSNAGKIWVNAVRKCLQVSLVPILRPWRSLSCKEVKKTAFDSHVPCYVQPDENHRSISICNLGISDFFSVFWTIKSSLVMATSETINGFWHTMLKCEQSFFRKYTFDNDVRKLRLLLQYGSVFIGRRRRSESEHDDTLARLGNKIVDHIAKKLRWEDNGVLWFADVDTSSNATESDKMLVNLFLANRQKFDLNADNITPCDMNSTVVEFQTKVSNGDLAADMDDVAFKVLSAEGCTDENCDTLSFSVIYSPDQKGGDTSKGIKTYLIIGISCVAFLVLLSIIMAIQCSRRRHGCGKGVV